VETRGSRWRSFNCVKTKHCVCKILGHSSVNVDDPYLRLHQLKADSSSNDHSRCILHTGAVLHCTALISSLLNQIINVKTKRQLSRESCRPLLLIISVKILSGVTNILFLVERLHHYSKRREKRRNCVFRHIDTKNNFDFERIKQ